VPLSSSSSTYKCISWTGFAVRCAELFFSVIVLFLFQAQREIPEHCWKLIVAHGNE